MREFFEEMSSEEMRKLSKDIQSDLVDKGMQRLRMKTGAAKVGRNQKCSCGSGKKFKKCCLRRIG